MKTNKILLGGITGGVILFLANWLIYGVLLKDYMAANSNQCFMKPMGEIIWWSLIFSNLSLGFLISLVFNWSNATNVMTGAKIAGIIGLLFTVFIDFQFYAMSNMFFNLNIVIVDIIVSIVMFAIGGAVVALVMGMGKKEA